MGEAGRDTANDRSMTVHRGTASPRRASAPKWWPRRCGVGVGGSTRTCWPRFIRARCVGRAHAPHAHAYARIWMRAYAWMSLRVGVYMSVRVCPNTLRRALTPHSNAQFPIGVQCSNTCHPPESEIQKSENLPKITL